MEKLMRLRSLTAAQHVSNRGQTATDRRERCRLGGLAGVRNDEVDVCGSRTIGALPDGDVATSGTGRSDGQRLRREIHQGTGIERVNNASRVWGTIILGKIRVMTGGKRANVVCRA